MLRAKHTLDRGLFCSLRLGICVGDVMSDNHDMLRTLRSCFSAPQTQLLTLSGKCAAVTSTAIPLQHPSYPTPLQVVCRSSNSCCLLQPFQAYTLPMM